MKELLEGQREIAEIDYLMSTDRETEAHIMYGELQEIKTHGLGTYADTMDLIRYGNYGEAFNYLTENYRVIGSEVRE